MEYWQPGSKHEWTGFSTFERLILPRIVVQLYWLVAGGILMVGLVGTPLAASHSQTCGFDSCNGPPGAIVLIAGVLALIAGELIWRIVCELAVLLLAVRQSQLDALRTVAARRVAAQG